jgi:hypothetical protein
MHNVTRTLFLFQSFIYECFFLLYFAKIYAMVFKKRLLENSATIANIKTQISPKKRYRYWCKALMNFVNNSAKFEMKYFISFFQVKRATQGNFNNFTDLFQFLEHPRHVHLQKKRHNTVQILKETLPSKNELTGIETLKVCLLNTKKGKQGDYKILPTVISNMCGEVVKMDLLDFQIFGVFKNTTSAEKRGEPTPHLLSCRPPRSSVVDL